MIGGYLGEWVTGVCSQVKIFIWVLRTILSLTFSEFYDLSFKWVYSEFHIWIIWRVKLFCFMRRGVDTINYLVFANEWLPHKLARPDFNVGGKAKQSDWEKIAIFKFIHGVTVMRSKFELCLFLRCLESLIKLWLTWWRWVFASICQKYLDYWPAPITIL